MHTFSASKPVAPHELVPLLKNFTLLILLGSFSEQKIQCVPT